MVRVPDHTHVDVVSRALDTGGVWLLVLLCLTLAVTVATIVVVARREQREYDRWYEAALAASGRPLSEVDGAPALVEGQR